MELVGHSREHGDEILNAIAGAPAIEELIQLFYSECYESKEVLAVVSLLGQLETHPDISSRIAYNIPELIVLVAKGEVPLKVGEHSRVVAATAKLLGQLAKHDKNALGIKNNEGIRALVRVLSGEQLMAKAARAALEQDRKSVV